jgi:hypothetical protein
MAFVDFVALKQRRNSARSPKGSFFFGTDVRMDPHAE